MGKQQAGITFITDTYRDKGIMPSASEVAAASGSTEKACEALIRTMRKVLGAPPRVRKGGHGRPSAYEAVVTAAIEGDGALERLPLRPSTIKSHIAKAIKEGRLKRKVVFA